MSSISGSGNRPPLTRVAGRKNVRNSENIGNPQKTDADTNRIALLALDKALKELPFQNSFEATKGIIQPRMESLTKANLAIAAYKAAASASAAPKQPLPASAQAIMHQAAMRQQASTKPTKEEFRLFQHLTLKNKLGTINKNEQGQLYKLENKIKSYEDHIIYQQSLKNATTSSTSKKEPHYADAPSLASDEAHKTKSPTFDEFDYDAELKKRNNANPYDSIDTPLD